MTLLIQNEAHRGGRTSAAPPTLGHEHVLLGVLGDSPPLFSGGKDPLEADDWLHTTESKFSLLHCTEYQKTLYAAQ
jgi:hypothetical protein